MLCDRIGTEVVSDRQIFLSGMLAVIRSEFETLPAQMKLALWLKVRMDFSAVETAEVLGIPVASVQSQVVGGVFHLREAIARKGVMTDDRSLAAALTVLPVERTPESLRRTIGLIAAADQSGRRIKRLLFSNGNSMHAGEWRRNSE
ncbi:MAG: hypothetical protein C0404_11810 [Verrucomicrobia bacterium]|nr:hypothetical protein [Verrucomicrobiota bacterium]